MKNKSILPTIGVVVYLFAVFTERYFYDLSDAVYNTARIAGIVLVIIGFALNIIKMYKDKNKKEQ